MAIIRVPQRTNTDCAICCVAAVLGVPYETVLSDRRERYGHMDDNTSWWSEYLADQGLHCKWAPTGTMARLEAHGGTALGLLVMTHPTCGRAHMVAADELGIVDPADGSPDHIPFDTYPELRRAQGFEFQSEFLLIRPKVFETPAATLDRAE